jgi:hypothetical protein
MELTWVAVIASVCMGLAAVCVFIFAVKKDYFHNIEDAKYQVFWSDLEESVPLAKPTSQQEKPNASGT